MELTAFFEWRDSLVEVRRRRRDWLTDEVRVRMVGAWLAISSMISCCRLTSSSSSSLLSESVPSLVAEERLHGPVTMLYLERLTLNL